MELGAAGLKQQPFRTHGEPLVLVPYGSQRAALQFLNETYRHPRGLGLFQGPSLSGKSAILRHFADSLPEDTAVALVDGAGMNTTALLDAVLSQLGYDLHFATVNERFNMVKVFALQQAASNHPPLLIVENTHALNPSALRVLCDLAELKVRIKSALRIVLASDRSIQSIIEAPAMEAIAVRVTGRFKLESMTEGETADYVYAKLRAGGCTAPKQVLPLQTCEQLYAASNGWPGVVDRLVLLALAKAERCPIESEHIEQPLIAGVVPKLVADVNGEERAAEGNGSGRPPKLFLTYNGRTLREIDIIRPRLLIGRSDHNDVCVNSRYISRHHALFVRHKEATFLMDLNSTNGTYVNSRRVSNHVLVHDDVISIGNHGVKFHDPGARQQNMLDGVGYEDTVIMKSLKDMRKLLARENTGTLSLPPLEKSAGGDSDR